MKKMIIGFVAALFVTIFSYGQKDNSDIDIVQSLFGRNKRLIITEKMQLSEKENVSFWRIYDAYEEKRKIVEKQSLILLKEYADNYEKLDDAEAKKLAVNFMQTMDDYNDLRKTYYKKMEKAVGSLKAATFIQLETFLQISMQGSLQSQVPIIGELERLNAANEVPKIEN